MQCLGMCLLLLFPHSLLTQARAGAGTAVALEDPWKVRKCFMLCGTGSLGRLAQQLCDCAASGAQSATARAGEAALAKGCFSAGM